MTTKTLLISFILLSSSLFLKAQGPAQPIFPYNKDTIQTLTPTLEWLTDTDISYYNVEVFNCSYTEGPYFDELDLSDYVHSGTYTEGDEFEASGLAFNERSPYMHNTVGDSESEGRAYQNNFSNRINNIYTGFGGNNDLEGITHIYDGWFAIAEESQGRVYFYEYNYNNGASVAKSTMEQIIIPGVIDGNTGLEGITYNPITNKLYLVKEKAPLGIYELTCPTAPLFNESFSVTSPFNLNSMAGSIGITDVSGMYHLGQDLGLTGTESSEHLLIISQESRVIKEIDLNGNVLSTISLSAGGANGTLPSTINKPEGVSYHNGDIYVVSDASGGVDAYYYHFTNPNHQNPSAVNNGTITTATNLSGGTWTIPSGNLQNNTQYCWEVTAFDAGGNPMDVQVQCFYVQTGVPGCTDPNACNYNSSATVDDGSCNLPDCLNNCSGTQTGPSIPGTSCNDNNPCTINDSYDNNCNCTGTFQDSDGDGICDANDQCPGQNDNLIGTTCNDNDVCTQNDIYQSDCTCAGTLIDANNDGICDLLNPCTNVIYDENFNNTLGSYTVVSGAFSNSQPVYESFTQQASNALLTVGGVDNVTTTNMSLGLSTSFSISTSDDVYIELDYTLNVDPGYDNGEWTQVLLEVDGQLVSYNGNNYLNWLVAGSPATTGAQNITITIPALSVGTHTIVFGLFNNAKTFNTEISNLIIDNITISQAAASQAGTACNDNDPCTVNDVYDSNCNCTGTFQDSDGDGVCDANDQCPGSNDALIGLSCNDTDPCTVNDVYDTNCNCAGIYMDSDADGVCDFLDQCPGINDNIIGTACNDNDPCTINDAFDNSCNCAGIPLIDSDSDGICDAIDQCPGLNDNLIGTACNDNDPCTVNDLYDSSCNCVGTFEDADNDGVCDANDQCPGLNDNLIGAACNDNDPCTVNDVYDSNCNCAGVFADADNDGVCDAQDSCPNFNNALIGTSCDDNNPFSTNDVYTSACICQGTVMNDSDNDGIPDNFDQCPNFDDNLIGTACDDMILCTINDTWDSNCNCTGTYVDSDNDGVCDPVDNCPGINDFIMGTTCDDGDPCTVNDRYDNNCNCTGSLLDADYDSICDLNDSCPGFNNNLIGQACNDNDPCTINETWDSNCNCSGGIFVDSDSDGICDLNDICPNLNNNVIGLTCNDNDPCTTNDVYTTNCLCEGTIQDSDGDGVCDQFDVCPGYNDNLDWNNDGIPDDCDNCQQVIIHSSGLNVSSDTYEADLYIQSQGQIMPGSNSDYFAGDYIELKSGFEIPAGAEIYIDIQDCNP